jgi:hypothetical protein
MTSILNGTYDDENQLFQDAVSAFKKLSAIYERLFFQLNPRRIIR